MGEGAGAMGSSDALSSEGVAPLVGFLVSACARDVSILVQVGSDGKYGRVVVIDLDPKHPRKIEDFARKERGLIELWRSGGGEGKVCASQLRQQ
jgi:hypothetical protein